MTALEILKQHEIKKTPARMSMIYLLQSAKYPMSEYEIKEQMADFPAKTSMPALRHVSIKLRFSYGRV